MKNLLRIFVILLLCLAANIDLRAGDARYSLGGGVGNMESFTFKAVLSGNFAIHADLGVKLLATSYGYKGFTRQFAPMWTFEANPNALYQSRIESCSWDWGDMSWFAGGGLSFGVAGVYAYDGYQYA